MYVPTLRTSARPGVADRPQLARRVLLAFVCLAAAAGWDAPPAAAQTVVAPVADSLYEARWPGGWRAVGRVVEQRGDSLVFMTIEGARLDLDRRYVHLRNARGRIVDGDFWPEDENSSRLFFAPTGRTLRANQGYAGLFLILPFVGYGINDDFTLAGGVPTLAGTLAQTPFYVAPKLRVHEAPGRQVSVGAVLMHVPDWSQDDYWGDGSADPDENVGWVGIGYGVGTFGTDDSALHVGGGVATAGGGAGVYVPVMVGGEHRFARRTKFITENWWVPGQFASASGGIRLLRTNWTTDLGMMFLLSEPDVPFFPIVSFSYAFGSGR